MYISKSVAEDNEQIKERYELSVERIAEIPGEITSGKVPCETFAGAGEFFKKTAEFILMIGEYAALAMGDELKACSEETLESWNHRLYEDILEDNYEQSFANPGYAVSMLKDDALGQMLSWLYTEIRGDIVYAAEGRLKDITMISELFIEIYNLFEEETVSVREVKDAIYWWNSDNSDIFVEDRTREQLDPEQAFAVDIIENADLKDLRYLYLFGEYISDTEKKTAQFLATLPQEQIDAMAKTYTEGYRIGFEVAGKPLYKKKTVNVRYPIGFERMVRSAIAQFAEMGLKPVIYREPQHSLLRRPQSNPGYCSMGANRQFRYDHKNDYALYFDRKFLERKLGVLKNSYEEMKELAAEHAGPAVIEVFGEKTFAPKNNASAVTPSEKQQQYMVQYASSAGQMANKYIKGEERSFTIIAYPLPDISDENYEEIFRETVKINTLDYHLYQDIQQKLIDALDQGIRAYVKGRGENLTELVIALHPISDPKKETIFENCVADVNIPVGEVFTSPILTGTNGLLHVTKVYLEGLRYEDLKIRLEDGMVKEYSCANFPEEEENKAYIREHILFAHESLPIGEFAIGTNTTAYAMAQKYGIAEKLPILIAEKMGPHFAFGDTCYSWEEDSITRNPDGKEIVAKENECSALRKEDPEKAYFNCHTDITIPYDELDSIRVETADGQMISIIENGRFVLPGTEELNRPLDV